MTLANRWVTTRQLGLLLGFMGQRVLGQYDLALLSAETTPGRLLFVEENIRQTAHDARRAARRRSGPGSRCTRRPTRSSSRRIPWLRPYLADRLERQLPLFSTDASRSAGTRSGAGPALRGDGRRDDQHWLERLMTDEQRALFRETQAVMSLLEGFGDHVMDEVGKDLVPGRRADLGALPRPARAAHAVRARHAPDHRHGPQDGAVPQGRGVRGRRSSGCGGAAALRRLWDGPETLPTRGGDRAIPRRWVRRMGLEPGCAWRAAR